MSTKDEDRITEALEKILKTHDPVSMAIDPDSLRAGRDVVVEIKFRPKVS